MLDNLSFPPDEFVIAGVTGMIPSTMGGKIIASAVFIDFGITDAITDKHRQYPVSFVIPIMKVEEAVKAAVDASAATAPVQQ